MELLIVTGMSGAGKSAVVDALEDLGYFCADTKNPHTFNRTVGLKDSFPKG